MKTRLSLCVIARNEGESIGRCLASAAGLAEQMIVVDTGSVDDTVEVARAAGASVFEEVWRGDFAAARNSSLERATGDWVLFLDCDEELDPKTSSELVEILERNDPAVEAYHLPVVNITRNGTELVHPSVRLFRNRPDYRFRGRIHEQIAGVITARSGFRAIVHSTVRILHYGYDDVVYNTAAKIRRNLGILESYPAEERDGFFHYNLGVEYLRLGDKNRALACFVESLRRTVPGQAFGPILVKRAVATLMDLGRFRDALEQLDYYRTIYPDFKDLLLLEGLCHLQCGRFTRASSLLVRHQEMEESPAWYPNERTVGGVKDGHLLQQVLSLSVRSHCPEISVCVVGREEADLLAHCLRSAAELASELIYVDTGSEDRSRAIAHQFGATVHRFPWSGDYSAARNHALEQARGEWVLFLDADEVLPDSSRTALEAVLRSAGADAYRLCVRTFVDQRLSPAESYLSASCRLFRNRGYRFRGAFAEDVAPSVLESGGRVECAQVMIEHWHHAAGTKRVEEHRRWKTQAISGRSGDGHRASSALGVEWFHQGDYQRAAATLAEARTVGGFDPRSSPDLFLYQAMAFLNVGDADRCAELLAEGTALFPDYTDLVYLKAILRFKQGAADEAAELLESCLRMGPADWRRYTVMAGMAGFKAKCSLATIAATRGDRERALDLFAQAAKEPGALGKGLEGLIPVVAQMAGGFSLATVLQAHGLLSSTSLSTAAAVLAKAGRADESLRCLEMAVERASDEDSQVRDLAAVAAGIRAVIGETGASLARKLPGQARLAALLNSVGGVGQ